MREVELTKGRVAIVDDEDFALVSRYSWHFNSYGYAGARERGTQRSLLMHRVIMNAPPGVDVDHINHDGLDNRRLNLRLCTRSQNNANMRPPRPGQFKGVWKRRGERYQARIQVTGKDTVLGTFGSAEEAARAYDAAAREGFGEFAYLNFAGSGRK